MRCIPPSMRWREMLQPMLRVWLDDNLPGMVERLIRTEIERVAQAPHVPSKRLPSARRSDLAKCPLMTQSGHSRRPKIQVHCVETATAPRHAA